MSSSVRLLGTDSRDWPEQQQWISRALDVIRSRSADSVSFFPGPTNPPPLYSGDIAEDLGGIGELQRFASSVEPRGFPHLTSLFGKPAHYLPIDFQQPILKLPRAGLLGALLPERSFVGSAVRLLAELDTLGPELGVTQDAGELGVRKLQRATETGKFPAERYSWAILRWFARMSLEKSAILRIG